MLNREVLLQNIETAILNKDTLQITSAFSEYVERNRGALSDKDLDNKFLLLIQQGTNEQITNAFSEILQLLIPSRLSAYGVCYVAMKNIIKTGNEMLIQAAFEKILQTKELTSSYCSTLVYGLTLLIENQQTYFLKSLGKITNTFHGGDIVKWLSHNGEGQVVWELFKLDKLIFSTPKMDRSSFQTTIEYFDELTTKNNTYELFLTLANDPDLIRGQDENGNTLLHIYYKKNSSDYDQAVEKILTYAPNLDFSIQNKNGDNVLHLSIIFYNRFNNIFKQCGRIGGEYFLPLLLKEREMNRKAANACNQNQKTPFHLLFDSIDINENSQYRKFIFEYALTLFKIGGDPTLKNSAQAYCALDLLNSMLENTNSNIQFYAQEWRQFRNLVNLNKDDIHVAMHSLTQKTTPQLWHKDGLNDFITKASNKGISFNKENQNYETPFSILFSEGDFFNDLTFKYALLLLQNTDANPYLLNTQNKSAMQILEQRLEEMNAVLASESPWESHPLEWKKLKKDSKLDKDEWKDSKDERVKFTQMREEQWSEFKQKAASKYLSKEETAKVSPISMFPQAKTLSTPEEVICQKISSISLS